ncbi:MAG: hypothetical protein ACYTHK_11125 [Planctomycetota bacterium]|jgi:hypothetical protein
MNATERRERDPDRGLDCLPAALRIDATLAAGGACTWPLDEVRELLDTARACGLACLGGEPWLGGPGSWRALRPLRFGAGRRKSGESWDAYVERSSEEIWIRYRERCSDEALRKAGAGNLDAVRVALRFLQPDGLVIPPEVRPRAKRAEPQQGSWVGYVFPPIAVLFSALLVDVIFPLAALFFFGGLLACLICSIMLLVNPVRVAKVPRVLLFLWNAWPIFLLILALVVLSTL